MYVSLKYITGYTNI